MRHLSHPVSFQRRLRWGLVLNLINPVFWMLPVSIHFRCLKNTLASEYWLFSVRVVCHFVFCCILLRFYFCCCVWFCFSSIGSIRWLSAYQGLITPLFLMHLALISLIQDKLKIYVLERLSVNGLVVWNCCGVSWQTRLHINHFISTCAERYFGP